MAAKPSLAAIKWVRQARGLSRKAFSDVPNRTYLSTLERGQKNPTLSKLDEPCEAIAIHPITLLTLAYSSDSPRKHEQLLAQVRKELDELSRDDT